MTRIWCLILLAVAYPCISVLEQQIAYQDVVRLIHEFTYAMDPEQTDDKPVIYDTPKLYSDALAKYSNTFRGDVMNDDVICVLILGIFKNYANIIKDQLAATRGHVTKEWVESYAVWSTTLLNITLKERYYELNSIRCYDKSPLELSCSLMLHKVMAILLVTGADVEQLYNCLILSTANSDTKGFDIVWKELCHQEDCSDACEVLRQPLPGDVISLRDINLSLLDVAMFQCKMSKVCTILDHVILPLCPTAVHHGAHVISTLLSQHVTTLTITQQCTPCNLMDVILHGCYASHGWRVGFLSETDHCQFPSLQVEQLTVEVLHLFAAIGQPLVIKGVGHDWSLLTRWRRHYLEEHYGTMEVLGGSIPYGEIFQESFGTVSVAEFLTYMDKFHNELPEDYYSRPIRKMMRAALPFYLFDVEVLQRHFSQDYTIPGSGAPFHFHCNAINLLVYGRKKWLMLPPGQAIYSKLHPLRLYSDQHGHILSDLKPLECVQHAGEMLYVPSNWGHATINLDESIGLAVEFEQPNC
ncbi:uncharacterized protein [Dysidea avara]|uniref:uncharacterized protein isoform X2 n=1 Tax=Dysidea avara TaxID=196820 RepID=UPI003324C0B3